MTQNGKDHVLSQLCQQPKAHKCGLLLFRKVTFPESVLMNRINHKVFHIHLADKIEFYPNKIA